jgi:hypothetical protein
VRIGRLGIRFQLESVVFEMMITLMCIKFGKLFFSSKDSSDFGGVTDLIDEYFIFYSGGYY